MLQGPEGPEAKVTIDIQVILILSPQVLLMSLTLFPDVASVKRVCTSFGNLHPGSLVSD